MQNNFDQFRYLFDYEEDMIYELPFYNIAVIKRNKDGNDGNGTIKQYFISNLDEYEKHQQEIITLCETFGARAYIDVQPRSYRDWAIELNYELANRLKSDNYDKLYRILCKSASNCKRLETYWILDIDNPDDVLPLENYLNEVISESEFPLDFSRASIYNKIKTPNGYHLITSSFDTRGFAEKFPNVEIKKNNMTLLYYPQCLD